MSQNHPISELLEAISSNHGGQSSGGEKDTETRKKERNLRHKANHRTKISDLYKRFVTTEKLKEGDVVRWKEGMQNVLFPGYEEDMVIVEVLDHPFYDGMDVSTEHNSGSPYWCIPLDVRLGVIAPDGCFITFYMESKRLRLKNPPNDKKEFEEIPF